MPAAPVGVRTGTDTPTEPAAAAILARLWGAFAREPIPGVTHRATDRGTLSVTLTDGTVLAGDAATAVPFAPPPVGFGITVTAPRPAMPRVLTSPGDLVRAVAPALGRHAQRLAEELDNSVANLALGRAAQPGPDGGAPMLRRAAAQPDPLAWLEQSVVDGHPLHPCARTRIGLTEEQVHAYAPEHRPVVRLRRVRVPERLWYGVGRRPMLLLHPFQHERLRDEYPWLSPVDGEVAARPLMSLRTLARLDRPAQHVKTAVDIQMTSAVRTVSPASIHNGFVLSRLLDELGVPGLHAAREAGGAAIVDGTPDRRIADARRWMPALALDEVALPLAVLGAPSHATGAPLLTEVVSHGYGGDPSAFVRALAGMLLRAVFHSLALGVALEAHGQNVLGIFSDGRLVRLGYRDFGGVRVSARRLKANGVEAPPLQGDIPSDDPQVLRMKVFASAVSTVLGEVIALLEREAGLDRQTAWGQVAGVARDVNGPDAAHLFAATLPLKAMTAMRLADRPVDDLWCDVPNPMAGLA